jgi:hypothetical protein
MFATLFQNSMKLVHQKSLRFRYFPAHIFFENKKSEFQCVVFNKLFFIVLSTTSTEQQETINKLQDEAEIKKTGIKAEAEDIKEETKLMTVEENVSEKLGTMTRYSCNCRQ